MIGHQSVIALRLEGYKPSNLWLILPAVRPVFGSFTHPETLMHTGAFPEVHVMPDEVVETLDLRFVRDVVVHIAAAERTRCRRALRRVVDFEPAKVVAAGDDWLVGWEPGRGYFNFLTETQTQ